MFRCKYVILLVCFVTEITEVISRQVISSFSHLKFNLISTKVTILHIIHNKLSQVHHETSHLIIRSRALIPQFVISKIMDFEDYLVIEGLAEH
jgi:hypothetical protein